MAAPYKNKNAEKWTLPEAKALFKEALELSQDNEVQYDFIGEIARELGVYREVFNYLGEKFKDAVGADYKLIMSNLEANCFSHSKKGQIKEATAIVNLKSNYHWKDRTDVTTDDKPIDKVAVVFENYKKD